MTELEFRSSPGLMEALALVLKDSTLQKAIEVIRSSPHEFPQQVPGVHYDLCMAREHAKTIGINSAIKKLHDLTKPLPSIEEMEKNASREEWTDYIPKEMQDALAKLNQQNQL